MFVVLVDPSRTVLKCLTRTLEAQGHVVHPFTGGVEALQYIKLNPLVDTMITSGQLSSMSGRELCSQVREVATCSRPIYILLMSSSDEYRNLIEALDNGADDFISKPPITEELYARLRVAERILSMQRELIGFATTDFLTGVLNRRAFFEKAKELCVRTRMGDPLCAIMSDIDHFKRINDSYGHRAGDEALRAVAHEFSNENGVVGRLGGEEFALLLEGIPVLTAAEIAERTRSRLEHLKIVTDRQTISLTCSFGVSQWRVDDTIDDLLHRADVALYKAKTGGRNQVEVGECMSSVADYDRSKRVVRSGGGSFRKSIDGDRKSS